MGAAEGLVAGARIVEPLTYQQLKDLALTVGAGGIVLITVCICLVLFFRRPPWRRKDD